jgi:cytochrome b involved in lipid metabolism
MERVYQRSGWESVMSRENGAVQEMVYDVSGFIEKHPGGARQLLLGAGRDITMVFESYHHFNNRLILITYSEI